MDDEGIGLISIISLAVMGLIVVVAAIGGIMYMTDTAVEATIVDKDCGGGAITGGANSQVTVKTKFPIPGIETTLKDFDDRTCSIVRAGEDGNYVKFHVKSERTIMYEREGGACVYDSDGVVC